MFLLHFSITFIFLILRYNQRGRNMKKERKIKKILAIFILLIMLSIIGLIKNEVKAANYSSKFTTISIPNKYEKSYVMIPNEKSVEYAKSMINNLNKGNTLKNNDTSSIKNNLHELLDEKLDVNLFSRIK